MTIIINWKNQAKQGLSGRANEITCELAPMAANKRWIAAVYGNWARVFVVLG